MIWCVCGKVGCYIGTAGRVTSGRFDRNAAERDVLYLASLSLILVRPSRGSSLMRPSQPGSVMPRKESCHVSLLT